MKNFTVTQTKLVINGKLVNSASGKTFDTLDPRTGNVICAMQEAGEEDVNRAVAAARAAFDDGPWPRMSGRERGAIMFKFADLLQKHAGELAAIETLDNGKPLAMAAAADIPLSIEHYRYFGGYADKVYGRTIPVSNGSFHAYTLHEPIGGMADAPTRDPSRTDLFVFKYLSRLPSLSLLSRASRSRRSGDAVELSSAHDGVEDGARAGHGQHGRAQVERADAADLSARRRARA